MTNLVEDIRADTKFEWPFSVAVLVPCYNEESAIQSVVTDFRTYLPGCEVHVFDNGSTDQTVAKAHACGAKVSHVRERGKGNVVRRMFADVEADVYVMVDGDDTYDAASVQLMVRTLVENGLDMVVGTRAATHSSAYRPGHRAGNWLLTSTITLLFGNYFTDTLTGYRAMSRRFVKSFPVHAKGFEIEAELAVHALELRVPFAEVTTDYRPRPANSESKLKSYRDGFRIMATILGLLRSERPLLFFTILSGLLAASSVALSIPLFHTYLNTGLVPRLPTAVLCAALMIVAVMLFMSGLILDTVTRGRIEAKRLAFLSIKAFRKSVR